MGYFKMKYEQFLMRLFNKILKIMEKNPNLEWYPKFAIGADYDIHRLEIKLDQAEYHLIDRDQKIIILEEKIEQLEQKLEES